MHNGDKSNKLNESYISIVAEIKDTESHYRIAVSLEPFENDKNTTLKNSAKSPGNTRKEKTFIKIVQQSCTKYRALKTLPILKTYKKIY